MAKTFFGLHVNLGAKFQNEIELLSLTKLRKNISPRRNLLYVPGYFYTLFVPGGGANLPPYLKTDW